MDIRMTLRVLTVCLIILCPLLTHAQEPSALLRSSLETNLGGTKFPSDLVLEGQLTDSTGTVKPIRVFIKNRDMMRYEVGTGDDARVTLFDRGQAWSIDAAGASRKLKARTAARRPALIPALDLMAELQNPGLELADHGLMTLGTMQARRLTLGLKDDQPEGRPFGRHLDDEMTVYIETSTHLVVRTERTRYADNNIDLGVPSVLEFSDYREVEGLRIPFRIVNTIGSESTGVRQSWVTITSVTVGRGIADSMFRPESTP